MKNLGSCGKCVWNRVGLPCLMRSKSAKAGTCEKYRPEGAVCGNCFFFSGREYTPAPPYHTYYCLAEPALSKRDHHSMGCRHYIYFPNETSEGK